MAKKKRATREELEKAAQELVAGGFEVEKLIPPPKPRESLKEPWEKVKNYHRFVQTSVYWESRQAFLTLIQSFLQKKIDVEIFSSEFVRLSGQTRRRGEEISASIEDRSLPIPDLNLNYTSKAEDFESAISDLFFEVDAYDSKSTESLLRSIIKKKYLPELQESCDLDDSFFQPEIDLDQLITRSYIIVFLIAIVLIGFLLANFIWV